MKDMYSFHIDQADLDAFYERSIEAYRNIYRRCGIGDITACDFCVGGMFSKYSHEFQTLTPYGEDIVYRVPGTDPAINKEIIGDADALRDIIPIYKLGDETKLEEHKAIEVGNISNSHGFQRRFQRAIRRSGRVTQENDHGLLWPWS